jgi:hypothetical protein
MLDDLISKREVYENAKMYQCVATLETSIEIAKHLIEKEKEQIEIAFDLGRDEVTSVFIIDGEDYYNKKFNQNK